MDDQRTDHTDDGKFLLTVALDAVGVGLLIFDVYTFWFPHPFRIITLWLLSWMLIGAGIMTPSNRTQLGAIVGGLLVFLAMLLLLFISAIHNW